MGSVAVNGIGIAIPFASRAVFPLLLLQQQTRAGNFSMPSNNRTTTTVRFGGKAVLNIDYEDYELSESHFTAVDKH